MFKKIFNTKNLVTLLALGVLFVILFFFYNGRVENAINPVTVPYALKEIEGGVEITSDMVGTMTVSPSMLEGHAIETISDVVGKYSTPDSVIPKGSLFYDRTVVDKEELPANIILDIPKGYVLYNLSVNTKSTYGNSMYPGNYIDIYLKAEKGDGVSNYVRDNKVVLGKFIENIKILAVKDSEGKPVFKDLEEKRTPSLIVFAVPEDVYILLKKAEYLRTYSSQLIPVPTNESLKNEPADLKMSSESLKNWINELTYWNS